MTLPFSYVETYSDITGCSTRPFIFTEWRTAYVGASTYPALAATVALITDGSVYVTYNYPDLILTALTPGETMTQVSA
jgi:hypothetical protein